MGSKIEYSLCFFDGENNLPLFNAAYNPLTDAVTLQRYYPRLRLYGGDLVIPLQWALIKAEAAYFNSPSDPSSLPARATTRCTWFRWNGR